MGFINIVYMDMCEGDGRTLIRCDVCRLYYHFCCIGLHPDTDIPAFTCSRCNGSQKVLPPLYNGQRRYRVTTDGDLLDDFLDGPAADEIGKSNCDDDDDDDGDDDDDDDCIIID